MQAHDRSLLLRALALLVAPVLLAGCGGGGGGGGGGPVEGLQSPAHLPLVEPLAAPASGGGPAAGAFVAPPGSDYEAATTQVRVYDPTLRPLQTVDRMLCLLAASRADLLVGEGAYLAQLDPARCEAGADRSTLGSETGRSEAFAAYELWTVDASRAGAGAPQYTSAWGPDDDPDDALDTQLRVALRIDAGAAADDPLGSWSTDYARVDRAAPDLLDPLLRGTLDTFDTGAGEQGFTLYEAAGDVDAVPAPGARATELQAHVRTSDDGTSGYARVLATERYHDGVADSGKLVSEYLVAFDATHLLRSIDGGADSAFARSSFEEHVWSYDLFHASGPEAGARVRLETGFGFRTEDGVYGYAGHDGVWLPAGTALSTGDTVLRDVYDEPGELVPYTVTRGGGKLVRLEREEVALDGVQGDPFEWWERDAVSSARTLYLITWDGASWVRTHVVDADTFERTELVPPTVIDTASLGYLSMWSDALGGLAAWTVDEPLVVTYHRRTLEGAASALFDQGASVRLYGLVDCLASELTAAEVEAGEVFLPDAPDVATPYAFVFEQADLTLYRDVAGDGTDLRRVGLVDGEVPSSGPYTWGLQSGPLVRDLAGLVEVRDVFRLDVFWQYETGPNDWNALWSLTDSQGNVVRFDAPLQFTYTHSRAADRNGDATYEGKSYLLRYEGAGRLRGFPREGVDLDGDLEVDRHHPVLALADGTLVGPTGTEYVVKARVVEQVLTPDPGGAPGLDLTAASDLTLPDASGYEPPAIGPAPVVTDPPRVVDGEPVGDV